MKAVWELLCFATYLGAADGYSYFLTGNSADARPRTSPGYLLAGGGKTDDESFRWFLAKGGGGDVVVLRASGGDGYHEYFNGLTKLDSVETIVFQAASAASDPFVLERIRQADALILAGGDQWNYVRYWKDSPVAAAITTLVERGVPIGGTSAGLAILGEYGFAAEHDTVTSAAALADPFDRKVSLVSGFLRIPELGCLITDSHFRKRDRMGRLLVFLARIREQGPCTVVRGIAVDERAAVRLEADGVATVAGEGSAYFLELRDRPVLAPSKPADIPPVKTISVNSGGSFHMRKWSGQAYELTVRAGKVQSSLSGGNIYGGAR